MGDFALNAQAKSLMNYEEFVLKFMWHSRRERTNQGHPPIPADTSGHLLGQKKHSPTLASLPNPPLSSVFTPYRR